MSQTDDQSKALAEFLARHAKSYDAATDDYERPAFAADIKEGKNDPIYNAHSYHTKVPPRSIIPYILHYTQPGDLVLDLFCGSGMTGVAAQMCAHPPADILESFPELKERAGPRGCILNDLSPAACHIAYNYNTPVDVEALKREFERIKAAVKDEFDWLYGTEHYEPAAGVYDVSNPDVASRLKNPPGGKSKHDLLKEDERTWELLTRAEVETRLGYAVTKLPRDKKWGDLDLAKVTHWVCIPAAIHYTIWSDVYRCEGFVTIEEPTGKMSTRGKNAGKPTLSKKRVARGCGKDIVLNNASLVHGHDDRQGSTFTCPNCNVEWQKSPLTWLRQDPVETCVGWQRIDSKHRTCLRQISVREIQLAQEKPKSDNWFPAEKLYENRELLTMGAGKRGIQTVADFYFPRQLRSLAFIFSFVERIGDERVRKAALFSFTAIALKCSRLNRLRPSGAGDPLTGTLYIGSLVREENTWETWQRRIDVLLEIFPRINSNAVVVRHGNAAKLAPLPDSSVDFVFADPPFGGNIFYADASLLWEGWLRSYTDVVDEMVIHRRSKSARQADGFVFKELEDYSKDMTRAFKEMFRVLKPGRWGVIEFNNSDGSVFEAIKQAITDSGFEIANMLLLDKQQKSFKQVQGALGKEEVVDKDVLFNLHKPAGVRAEASRDDLDLQQQLADAVRQHLQTLPERIKVEPAKYNDEHRTAATINSMLMNTLIPRGVNVARLNLPFIERVCSRYFRKVGQRWYLRGEAVTGEGLVQEDATIKDELTAIAWLRQRIAFQPALIGELKPHWMKATGLLPANISQALVLENLLTENFWRDADSNRWREPTDEERERMNDDRSLRVLHDAERFVNNTLDLPSTDTERCEWIEVLFQACRAIEDNEADALPALRGFDKAEAYSLIPRLFQSVLGDHVSKEAYTRAEKQARAAAQRVARNAEDAQEAKGKRGKDSNQPTFDFGT